MGWHVLPRLADEEVKGRGPDVFWTRTGPVMGGMGRKPKRLGKRKVRWGMGRKRRPGEARKC